MSTSSTARVATASASRYLQQTCKHWAHNLQVEFDASKGTIVFPRDARGATWQGDATVTFTAEPDTLVTLIEASEDGQLQGLKGAVERHVNRFAFREGELEWTWTDDSN